MKILEYIALSIALTLPLFLTLHECAGKVSLRLSRGLVISLLMAVGQAAIILLGMLIGNQLRFDMPVYDSFVFLGLVLVVAFRFLFTTFRKQKDTITEAFDISRWSTVILLSIASATNAFIVGIGLGFRTLISNDACAVAIPMAIAAFLFSYWGIMFGRQHKKVRPRRWLLISILILLVYAVKGVVDA